MQHPPGGRTISILPSSLLLTSIFAVVERMLSDADIERRLRAVDDRTNQAAQARRYYDTESLNMSTVQDATVLKRLQAAAPPGNASRLTTAEEFLEGAGPNGTFQNFQPAACQRCQSLDVSLQVLRSNVAKVEEGYIQQIDQLSESIDVLEAERSHLINQAQAATHEAELQHSAALKRNTELSTLKREVARLELESDTLQRQLSNAQRTAEYAQKYAYERAWLHLLHEEAVSRSEISCHERAWWEITVATWNAERLADRQVEQAIAEFELRQRIAGPALTSSHGSSVDSPMKGPSLPLATFATSFSNADSAAALRSELTKLDSQLHEAMANIVRLNKALGSEQRVGAQLREERRLIDRHTVEMEEQVNRMAVECQALVRFSSFHQKLALAYQSGQDAFLEHQKKQNAAREKELSTLRKMLMEAKDEAFAAKKQLTAVEAERNELKAKVPSESSTTGGSTTTTKRMTEVACQTSLGELDLITQLRELLGTARPAPTLTNVQPPSAAARRTSVVSPSTPSGLDSPLAEGIPASGASDAPSPQMQLDPITPPAHPRVIGLPPGGVNAGVEISMLQQLLAGQESLRVMVQGLAAGRKSPAPSTPTVAPPIVPNATAMAPLPTPRATPAPETDDHLIQLKFTLRNLLVCVGQHQRSIFNSVAEVSKSLTSVQNGIDRLEGGQTAMRGDLRLVEVNLARAVERQLSIDRQVAAQSLSSTGAQPLRVVPSGDSATGSPAVKKADAAAPPTATAAKSTSPATSKPTASPPAATAAAPAPAPTQLAPAKSHHWDDDEEDLSEDCQSPVVIPSHSGMRQPALAKMVQNHKTPFDLGSDDD
jgi:hypothetical protein